VNITRREWLAIGLLTCLAVVAWLVVGSYPAFDAYYHLDWGRELFAGQVPTIGAYKAPTAHPLYLLVAAFVGAIFGGAAGQWMVLVAVLSLLVCAWSIWRLGRTVFGFWPGLVAAVLVVADPTLLLYAARAFPDLLFLALVFLAAALEAEKRRRGAAVMVLLAAAGLLRPEAWVLAGAYWCWCVWPTDFVSGRRDFRFGLLALVLAAPLLWGLFDWWAVGQPLYALTETSSLAAALGRRRGLAEVPAALIDGLLGVLRSPVLALALVGVGIELVRRRAVALYVPAALIVIGLVTFLLVGIFGLSLLPRYLVIPSITLLLFAGYALAGWVELPTRTALRRAWASAAVVVIALAVALTISQPGVFTRAADEVKFVRGVHADLVAVLGDPAVTAARRCGPVSLPTFGLVPDSLWIVDAPQSAVVSRSDWQPTSGVALVFTDSKSHRRYGLADGTRADFDRVPLGFRLIARHGRIAAWSSCR